MATSWDLLDERALLWTSVLNKSQQTILQPHLQHLSPSRSTVLLIVMCRSFSSATRVIWEGFRALLSEAASPNGLATADPILPQSTSSAGEAAAAALQSDRAEDIALVAHSLPWDCYPISGRRGILVKITRRTSMLAWTPR